jgi:fatty acid desaturase
MSEQLANTERPLKDYLSREEITGFTQKSDLKAFSILAFNWLAIISILSLVYVSPGLLTLLFALVFLPGRQLALSIVMHDCGHRVFFSTKERNDFYGQWFASRPVLQDLHSYARGHLKHHQNAGTVSDPDLNNYKSYPVEKESFKRKVVRDLTGQTAWKLLKLVLMAAKMYFSSDPEKKKIGQPFFMELVVQFILFVLISIFLAPWVYFVWVLSWMTTYMFIVRFRQVAEHAAVKDLYDLDPRKNTRTTIPSWFERAIIAPGYVNYHLEHHFLASVPCYNLPKLHKLLKDRGAYDNTSNVAYGYRQVLREALV